MNNRIFIISLFLLCLISIISAQDLTLKFQEFLETGLYGPDQAFPTSMVVSDFGKRDYPDSPWHKGVDYDGDIGDHLLSLVAGDITIIYNDNYTYKFITIDNAENLDFGYGHIFADGDGATQITSGDLTFKRLEYPYEDHYAIIREVLVIGPIIYTDIQDGSVIYNGMTYTYDEYEEWWYFFEQEEIIAPLGTSGTGESNSHLHLYRFEDVGVSPLYHVDNTKNPLEVVVHDKPNYTVTIDAFNHVYPGNEISSFKVKCSMDGETQGITYSNSVGDIEKVELMIKKENESSYSVIQGPDYESYICLGGAIYNERYPSGNQITSAEDGSFTHTGITPHAYSDQGGEEDGQPWDYYYFSDFATRLKESNGSNSTYASINEEAMYPDGDYNVKAKLTRINDSSPQFESDNFNITIDNFRPYVKAIVIKKDDEWGSTIYEGEWSWNGSELVPDFENYFAIAQYHNIYIEITTSEPMEYIELDKIVIWENEEIVEDIDLIPNLDFQSNDENITWEATIDQQHIVNAGTYVLHLIGHDYEDHELLTLSDYPYQIPIHQSNGSWLPDPTNLEGTDIRHYFAVEIDGNDEITSATQIVAPFMDVLSIDPSIDVDWYRINNSTELTENWYIYLKRSNSTDNTVMELWKATGSGTSDTQIRTSSSGSGYSFVGYNSDYQVLDIIPDEDNLQSDEYYFIKVYSNDEAVYNLYIHQPLAITFTYPNDGLDVVDAELVLTGTITGSEETAIIYALLEVSTDGGQTFGYYTDVEDFFSFDFAENTWAIGDELNYVLLFPWDDFLKFTITDNYDAFASCEVDITDKVRVPTPSFDGYVPGVYDHPIPFGGFREDDGISINVRDGNDRTLKQRDNEVNNYMYYLRDENDLNDYKFYLRSDDVNFDSFYWPPLYDETALGETNHYSTPITITETTEFKARAYSVEEDGRSSLLVDDVVYTLKAKKPGFEVTEEGYPVEINDNGEYEGVNEVHITLNKDDSTIQPDLSIYYAKKSEWDSWPPLWPDQAPSSSNTDFYEYENPIILNFSEDIEAKMYQVDNTNDYYLEPSEVVTFKIIVKPTLEPFPGWHLNQKQVFITSLIGSWVFEYAIGDLDSEIPDYPDDYSIYDIDSGIIVEQSSKIYILRIVGGNPGNPDNPACYEYYLGSNNVRGIIRESLMPHYASPYYIQSDIEIDEGFTVTMESGIELYFTTDAALNVKGILIAKGTPGDFIVFSESEIDNKWDGIRFLECEEIMTESSELEYCNIQKSDSWGIEIYHNNVSVINCEISENDYGIFVENSSPTIFGNLISDSSEGVKLENVDYIYFSNNDIYNNTTGVRTIHSPITILNCKFYNNGSYNLDAKFKTKLERAPQILNCFIGDCNYRSGKNTLDIDYQDTYNHAGYWYTNVPVDFSYEILYNYSRFMEEWPHANNVNNNWWHLDYWHDENKLKVRGCKYENPDTAIIDSGRLSRPSQLSYSLWSLGFPKWHHYLWNSNGCRMKHEYFNINIENVIPYLDIAGVPRIRGNAVDIGAYEMVQTGSLVLESPSYNSAVIWGYNENEILITGDVTIEEDGELTILPGVSIIFQEMGSINVHGKLIAEGFENNQITFTTTEDNQGEGWGGIHFQTAEESILKNCIIEYAKYWNLSYGGPGITILNCVNPVTIENCIIRYCFSIYNGAGIYISYSDCNILNNEIYDNVVECTGDDVKGVGYIAMSQVR
jgi:parallel beta-helix repeat protein